MEDKNIFIHIPKTGGVTINTAMHNVPNQTKIDFNYRHLDLGTFRSTCADIFNPSNFDKYQDYDLITMVREPVDRLASQYYSYKGKTILKKLMRSNFNNFKEYVSNPRTSNFMVGFLLGKPLYSREKITAKDLDLVIKTIEALPIHVGVFEHYNESMGYFQDVTGIKWHKKLDVKRITLSRVSIDEITEEERAIIRKKNTIDFEFYTYCQERFESIRKKYEGYQINFIKNKYDKVIPFASSVCLFEICVKNKSYLKLNFDFFKKLNFYLLNEKEIGDGRVFCDLWNKSFLIHIEIRFNGSDFYKGLELASNKDEDPLKTTMNIGQALDEFFRNQGKKGEKYFKRLEFNKDELKHLKPSGNSIISRLFRR